MSFVPLSVRPLDRGGQPQGFRPNGRADVLDVERAADHRLERVIGGIALRDVGVCVAQSRMRGAKEAQEVHQGEDVIGEARRVGVVPSIRRSDSWYSRPSST